MIARFALAACLAWSAAACGSDAATREDGPHRPAKRRVVSLQAAKPLFQAHLEGKLEAQPVPDEYRAGVEIARTNGRYLEDHDRAVRRAAKALHAELAPIASEIRGALAWREGGVWKIHFVVDRGDWVSAEAWIAADGTVASRGEGLVALAKPVRDRWLARQAALETHPQTRDARWQAVVVGPVPVDGARRWVVTLVRRTPGDDSVPIGGHRTLFLNPNTLAVVKDVPHANREQRFPRHEATAGTKRAITVSHVRSATPIDTHVFTSLHYGVKLYVATSAGAWVVDGETIGFLGRPDER